MEISQSNWPSWPLTLTAITINLLWRSVNSQHANYNIQQSLQLCQTITSSRCGHSTGLVVNHYVCHVRARSKVVRWLARYLPWVLMLYCKGALSTIMIHDPTQASMGGSISVMSSSVHFKLTPRAMAGQSHITVGDAISVFVQAYLKGSLLPS